MRDPFYPDRDAFGNRIRPGDRVTHDMLGRPVQWQPPISMTLTACILIGGGFAGRDYFGPSFWTTVGFWACLVLGGLWALCALELWHEAMKGVGIRVGGLIGAALLFGVVGGLIDWSMVGRPSTWAVAGAAGGAALELILGQIAFRKDPDDSRFD